MLMVFMWQLNLMERTVRRRILQKIIPIVWTRKQQSQKIKKLSSRCRNGAGAQTGGAAVTDQEIIECLGTEFSKHYQVPRERIEKAFPDCPGRIEKWFTRICCYSISSGANVPGCFWANLEDFKRNRKKHAKNNRWWIKKETLVTLRVHWITGVPRKVIVIY
mgnify:CR=1 FL=1